MSDVESVDIPEASLLVIQGADQGARYFVEFADETDISMGRGIHNNIRLHDSEVSRRHAVIGFVEGAFRVTDCESSNGTFVNGKRIDSSPLTNGDRLRLGGTMMLFASSNPLPDHSTQRIRMQSDSSLLHPPDSDGAHGPGSIVGQLSSEESQASLFDTATPSNTAQMLVNLQVLYRVSELAVSPATSRQELLERILDLTLRAVNADRGCILLTEVSGQNPTPEAFRMREAPDSEAEKMPISRSIVDYVLENRRAVRTADAQHDERFESGKSILRAGIREAMCVPLEGHDVLGAIYLDTTAADFTQESAIAAPGSLFSEDQLRLLAAIGRQAALALDNFRYQHALVTAERLAAMGQTIAMLSHHIKNILQGVRGGSFLIDRGLSQEDNELVKKGWGIVERNQDKIFNLVMDMLSISKDRQPALEPGDLNKVVFDVCELMKSRAEELGVGLEFKLEPGVPETLFDAEGISRAVLNVVTNAIDAVEGRDNGKVFVRTGYRSEADVLVVSVTDNGPGIPAEARKAIFELFESTKGSRGTGLGLAVSQKILREHGGDIHVESRVGRGSRFVLSWPQIHEDKSRPGGVVENTTGEYDIEDPPLIDPT